MQQERQVGMVIRHQGIPYFHGDEGFRHGLRYVTKRSIENHKLTCDHESIVVTIAKVYCKNAWDDTSVEW